MLMWLLDLKWQARSDTLRLERTGKQFRIEILQTYQRGLSWYEPLGPLNRRIKLLAPSIMVGCDHMRENSTLLFSGSGCCLKPASSSPLEITEQLSDGMLTLVTGPQAHVVTVHNSQPSQNGRLVPKLPTSRFRVPGSLNRGCHSLSVGAQSCARTNICISLTERVAIDSTGGAVSFYKIIKKLTEIY
jgi:hypothetical protein